MAVHYKENPDHYAYVGEKYTKVGKAAYTAYEGLVVKIIHRTVQIMSDVWEDTSTALVWQRNDEQPDRSHLKWVDLWSSATAEVDAPESVYEEIRAHEFAKKLESLTNQAAIDAKNPTLGQDKVVKILKGKDKALKGKVGTVFKLLASTYNMGYKSVEKYKLGIRFSDEKTTVPGKNGKLYQNWKEVAWVWPHNVEVVDWEKYLPEIAVLNAAAEHHADETVKSLKDAGSYFRHGNVW